MNPSANNNEQQGEPSWATENWDSPGAVGSPDHPSRQYSGPSRLEWEWDPMILAQHPGSGASNDGSDGDRMNNQISAGTMSTIRQSYNMLSAGLPSNFTHNNPMGNIFSSAGIRNFGPMDGSGQLPSSSNLHGVLGSGIPGLAATSGTACLDNDIRNDIRNFDQQRRRELFVAGIHDHHVKREEISDGHTRIGLNLGVRTYFSTEDTAAGRLVKRHRAGSPGSQVPMCQAEGCKADLSTAKTYHRRHKVCEHHSKAPNLTVAGHTQRFCQQCSRFHLLGEFDDGKRSCRKRLADHNRRRRKPQANASQTGGPSAESIGMKSGDDDRANGMWPTLPTSSSDQKSMLMNLKKSGSPSSVSLEDSDEKPGTVGNNLQLRTSGSGFRRAPGDEQRSLHSGMQMSSQPMTGSDAQALLSAMSLSPSLMLQNPQRQLTMMAGTGNHGQDHAAVYQHYLQGVNASQTGPNLSLSPLGGQLGLSHQAGGRGQPVSNQILNGMDSTVSWLRSDLTQVVGRSGTMNLQHLMHSTDSKSGITSASANSPNSQEHDVQVFSPSNQNLIPLQSSRDIASPEWMLSSMTGGQTPRAGSNHFGPSSSLNNITPSSQLESGHQMLALIETSNQAGGNPGHGGSNQNGQGGHTQIELMQQHNTGTDSGGDNNSRGGGSTVDSPDLKYPELQAPRPNYGPSSIYDSHHNLLSDHFSYEFMV